MNFYVGFDDHKAALDSVFRPVPWQILASIGVPSKLIGLIAALYFEITSSVRAEGQLSPSFQVLSGVRQGCVLASNLFNTAIDWVMERTVGKSMNGISGAHCNFTDLDYADDIALLAELFDILYSTLEIFSNEANPLGLQANWARAKLQSLGNLPASSVTFAAPTSFTMGNETVDLVNRFVYLGSTMDSSCSSQSEISKRM